MQPFKLHRPQSLQEATRLFTDDSAYLAGGHTLIPQMKHGQQRPSQLIDLSAIKALREIKRDGPHLHVGAMVTYSQLIASEVAQPIAGLIALAQQIGDPQLRNRGRLGGSLAANNPESDYPAALIALNGIVETNFGTHTAEDFLQGPFATILSQGELITNVIFQIPQASAYSKFAHPASRHPIAGVFIARYASGHVVGITGATKQARRWPQAEDALDQGKDLTDLSVTGDDLTGDSFAGPDYRGHLAGVMLRRAINQM